MFLAGLKVKNSPASKLASNFYTLVARINLPRGAAEISNYVEFYIIRAASDPMPQAINYE